MCFEKRIPLCGEKSPGSVICLVICHAIFVGFTFIDTVQFSINITITLVALGKRITMATHSMHAIHSKLKQYSNV
jgi:hypothetical protein